MRNVWFVAVPAVLAALWAIMLWQPKPRPKQEAPPNGTAAEAEPAAPRAHEIAATAPAPPPAPKEAAPTQTTPTSLPSMPPPPTQGPVRDLKQRYQSESAPGTAPAEQQQLTAAFQGPVADLLDSVECRRTVCRVRLAWLPKHGFSGMSVLSELRGRFDRNLAIDEAGPTGANGMQSIDLYIDLTATKP